MVHLSSDPDVLTKKTFLWTILGVILYAGAVYQFVLNDDTTTGVPQADTVDDGAHL